MKSLIVVLIGTILFISLGIYTNNGISNFTNKYDNDIKIIENHVKNDQWDDAQEALKTYSEEYHDEKDIWYKLLDHTYFDDICLYMNILDKSIKVEDKMKAYEMVILIKITLENILESEKFDIKHIL